MGKYSIHLIKKDMKKRIIKYIISIVLLSCLFSCNKAKYIYFDNESLPIDSIGSVKLRANHILLIADGNAQIDLKPTIKTKGGKTVLDSRVKEEWLEYFTTDGVRVNRYFSTKNSSLIGKTLEVMAVVAGKDIISDTVKFQVVAPMEQYEEIVIPIIFHIVQTTEDIDSYGGLYKRDIVDNVLLKLNNVFSGIVSNNAVGVNTRIRFKLAEYNPDGNRLNEIGINRHTVNEVNLDNMCVDFIESNKLDWPAQDYMNVWLVSDRTNLEPIFGKKISLNYIPKYIYPNVDETTIPKGLTLTKLNEGDKIETLASGIVYKAQLLNLATPEIGRNDNNPGDNEIIHYIGSYFGLKQTFNFSTGTKLVDDFCADTHKYNYGANNYLSNKTSYKEANNCIFLSENIMDDPLGMHRTISKNQCERIRWVLNNCPERGAWKSNFAFSGKK